MKNTTDNTKKTTDLRGTKNIKLSIEGLSTLMTILNHCPTDKWPEGFQEIKDDIVEQCIFNKFNYDYDNQPYSN